MSFRLIRIALLLCPLLSCAGCSSLGLSLFPTGHFLTDQAEAVLQRSPRVAEIPRELSEAVVPAHYLQPGDVLLIEPVDLESNVRIPADQQVQIDGSVDLGGMGRVVVVGLTIEMAEKLIERTIFESTQQNTSVNVRLLEPVNRYYVLGEVNSPGSYPLAGHETILDGILAAGGLTSAAAPCKILLARPTTPESCRITLPVCYREITQLGDTTTNYQLQPGDRIFVASRSWHEDLMFWNANKTCARCCGCQSPCVDPSIAAFTSTVSPVPVDEHVIQNMRAGATDSESAPLELHTSELPAPNAFGVVQSVVESVPVAEAVADTVEERRTPNRLPPAADGELDFDETETTDRFEPLWITQ